LWKKKVPFFHSFFKKPLGLEYSFHLQPSSFWVVFHQFERRCRAPTRSVPGSAGKKAVCSRSFWLLRTDAYFGKPFTNMLPSTWQVALGVVRIPNTLGSAAVFGFVLAPSLLRGGHLSAAACCPYSGRRVLAIGEVVACCDVVLGWHFFFCFCFFFFLALTALAYR
jgi:hypothetical protein